MPPGIREHLPFGRAVITRNETDSIVILWEPREKQRVRNAAQEAPARDGNDDDNADDNSDDLMIATIRNERARVK